LTIAWLNLGDDSKVPAVTVIKACNLNPLWFDSIAKNGVPEGALDSLCALAKEDE